MRIDKLASLQVHPWLVSVVALLLIFVTSNAQASGFQILEQSAEGVGKAFAGASAGYGDGSEIAFNPAAMSFIEGTTLSHSSHLVIPSSKFRNRGSSNLATGLPLSGDNGPDAGGVLYVPSVYLVTPVNEDINFGFGIHSPFGLSTDYDRNWVGRYHAVESELTTISLSPSLSYQVTDQLSIGAGAKILYSDATLSNAVDFGTIGFGTLGAATASSLGLMPQGNDGFAEVQGDDWSVGYVLGLAYEYAEGSRIGLAYHSKIDVDLNGTANFEVPMSAMPLTSTGLFTDTGGSASVTLPDYVNLGVRHVLTDRTRLLAELSWTHWSRFNELIVEFDSVQPDSVTPEEWGNTFRYSIGLDYDATEDLTLSTGFTYDETPIENSMLRTARIPGNDRKWLSLGAKYALTDQVDLVVSYSHLFVSDPAIDNIDGIGNRLVGEFDANVNIVAVGLNVSL